MSLPRFFALTVDPLTTPRVSVIIIPGIVSVFTTSMPCTICSMVWPQHDRRFKIGAEQYHLQLEQTLV